MDDQLDRRALAFKNGDHLGLTKRELFAAMAMQGYCARPQTNATQGPNSIADLSIDTADALLKALATP